MLIVSKPNGHVKLMVYRKKTHTEQYLHFDSHHPVQHKLSVIGTLLDRCRTIVSEKDDHQEEIQHVQTALTACCYPKWSMDLVAKQQKTKDMKQVKQIKKGSQKCGIQVVIPYVKGLSEAVSRIFTKFGVSVASKPFKTICNELVHPKNISAI